MTRVERFHTAFNAAYDSILKKYKKHVVFFIHKKWLSFGLVTASITFVGILYEGYSDGHGA